MKYCNNCKQIVEPKRHFNAGILIVLLCLGVIPGLIYYLVCNPTCPICNSENWGAKPQEKKK